MRIADNKRPTLAENARRGHPHEPKAPGLATQTPCCGAPGYKCVALTSLNMRALVIAQHLLRNREDDFAELLALFQAAMRLNGFV